MKRKKKIPKKMYRYYLVLQNWMIAVIALLFVVALLVSQSGCSTNTVTSQQTIGVLFKYDLKGSVNGVPFDGAAVLPHADKYEMKIESKVDADYLTVMTCHRNFGTEAAIRTGWFRPNRGYSYTYTPSQPPENGSCLVRLATYNKTGGQNAWGIIDFEDPEYSLPALNMCDGGQFNTGGVSICQSKAGLLQVLKFPTPVKQATNPNPKCQIAVPADKMTWEYTIQPGECVILLGELDGSHRVHRHTTIGYDQILIRGE